MEPFPEDILQFLQAFISSIDHLEILRVLGDAPNREWTDSEVETQAQVRPERTRTCLKELEQHGFIRCRLEGAQLICRFAAHTPELEKKLQQLLFLYRQRPVTMIRMIYERSANPLRDFADAFRLKSED